MFDGGMFTMTEELHEEKTTGLEEGVAPETITEEPEAPAAESLRDEAAPSSEEVRVDEKMQQLEAQLAEAERKAAEYLDGLQRSQASFANYRKRTEAEQVSWRSVANAALLSRFLPVLDDFERAFRALPQDLETHPWLGGINLIQRKIAGILESENVKPIEVQPGDEFDPLYHQAVLHQEVPGFDEGQIVAEVERGYTLGERLLRPTSVVVAKAPARIPEPEPEPEVVDAESVDAESVAAEPIAAEVIDAAIIDAEVIESEVVASAGVDAEPAAPAAEQSACCCEDDDSCTNQDPA
jgi:molecular chaperone GrpE